MSSLLRYAIAAFIAVVLAVWIGGAKLESVAVSPGAQSQHVLGVSELTSPIPIRAVGKQFHWTFHYPGKDATLGTDDDVSVSDQLHLPAGIDVLIHLESEDYVYSLNCPSLELHEIAVPDLNHHLSLDTSDQLGRHAIEADPMCGWRAFHDDILGWIIIETQSDFSRWAQSHQ